MTLSMILQIRLFEAATTSSSTILSFIHVGESFNISKFSSSESVARLTLSLLNSLRYCFFSVMTHYDDTP